MDTLPIIAAIGFPLLGVAVVFWAEKVRVPRRFWDAAYPRPMKRRPDPEEEDFNFWAIK